MHAPLEHCGIVGADEEPVGLEVVLESVCAEHLEDADQLIVVVTPTEEVLFVEDLRAC